MKRMSRPGPAAPGGDCPCGLPAPYDDCCGRLHRADARAPTAERLMRSRFSAFHVHDEAYLLRTWHPSTRPADVDFDRALEWVRLEILGTTGGSFLDDQGTVRFRAHYREAGRPGVMEEASRFVAQDGAWLYVGPV